MNTALQSLKRDKKHLRMILEYQEEFRGTIFDPHKTLYVFKTEYKDSLHRMRNRNGLDIVDTAYHYCTKFFYCFGTHSISVHSRKSKYNNLHRFSWREE